MTSPGVKVIMDTIWNYAVCGSRKCPYSARGGIGNSWGREGSQRAKMLRKCMKHNWNYQRGGVGMLGSIPLVGEVLIIYRTIYNST